MNEFASQSGVRLYPHHDSRGIKLQKEIRLSFLSTPEGHETHNRVLS